MSCIFKVEILLPKKVIEFFYHRLDSNHDDHNLNKLKDKLFKRYEILNNASFRMVWIDNAGDRINILEEDDLSTFVEMKGSKVIVLADKDNEETIINESVKNSELKCSGCNVELRGIRFGCTDRFNFYLCFLCGMSKKQYNLATTIHTVQPLNESHTMITSSSQSKEISEWMENSRKSVTDLMNELKSLEEKLISILRRGTTAVKTVATRKELLQVNLRGSKSIKEDAKVIKTLSKQFNMPSLDDFDYLVSPEKPIAPKDEAKEGSVKHTIPAPKNSSDNSLDWQGPNNFSSKYSKETVTDSGDDTSSDWNPSQHSRKNRKHSSEEISSEEEDANKVHEHPKDSSNSDDSSLDEDEVQIVSMKLLTAAPANSRGDSSWDWLNLVPLERPKETVSDSSDDSSSDEDEVKKGPVKHSCETPENSSDDSSSDEEEANIIPSKSSRENPKDCSDDCQSEAEDVPCGCCPLNIVEQINSASKSFEGNNTLISLSSSEEYEVKLPFLTTTVAKLVSPVKLIAPDDEAKEGSVKPQSDSSLHWQRPNNCPSKSTGETVNYSMDDSSSDWDEVQKGPVKHFCETPENSSDDSSSDEEEANIIPSKSSRENPKDCSDDCQSEAEDVPCGCCPLNIVEQINSASKSFEGNNTLISLSSSEEYEVKLPFLTTTVAKLVSPVKLIAPDDEAKEGSVKPQSDSSLDWQRPNNCPSKSTGETVNYSMDDSSSDGDEVQKGPVKSSVATPTNSSDDSSSVVHPSKVFRATPMVSCCHKRSSSEENSSDQEMTSIIPSKVFSATPTVSCGGRSSKSTKRRTIIQAARLSKPIRRTGRIKERRSSSEKSSYQPSPARSVHTSDDKPLDKEEARKSSLEIPISSVQPTQTIKRTTRIQAAPSSEESSSDEDKDEEMTIPSKVFSATPMVSCGGSPSKSIKSTARIRVSRSSSEESSYQASPATSVHTSDDKASDKEEARKSSLEIPKSSVQPTLIENMNLPKDLLQWIQWINRTQQN